jgi:hypothetical protein
VANPFFRFVSDGNQSLKVIKTEGCAVTPGTGPVLERSGESRCEERSFLADILPDRGFDIAAAQCVSGLFFGSHLVSSFVEMKLALSQEEESQCTFQGRKLETEAGAGVPKRIKRRE